MKKKKMGRVRKSIEVWDKGKEAVWRIVFPGIWPYEGYTSLKKARKALAGYRKEWEETNGEEA
jgi:hypothetical protein